MIGSNFIESTYRIERQLFPPATMSKLLADLVYAGIPQQNEEFPPDAVKKKGDAGQKVQQLDPSEYRSALQTFTQAEFHHHPNSTQHSLVYAMEELAGPPLDRSEQILSQTVLDAAPFFLRGHGSAHLYMSAPSTAALANHTDITDIVVVQLDGAKEWWLCSEKKTPQMDDQMHQQLNFLRHPEFDFSRKLSTCSTYDDPRWTNGSSANELPCIPVMYCFCHCAWCIRPGPCPPRIQRI